MNPHRFGGDWTDEKRDRVEVVQDDANDALLRLVRETNWSTHRALTRCFGTDEWRDAFYQVSAQGELFGGDPGIDKVASFDSIAAFFRSRLETIFEAVSPNSLPLFNSRNNPLFLLCFAASNERGAKIAAKIANDILGG